MFRRLTSTSLRPIHIGRKLIDVIEKSQAAGVAENPTVPNVYEIHVNAHDREAFGDLEKLLIAELIEAAQQYVSDQAYALAGDVSVSFVTDPLIKRGRVEIRATSVARQRVPSAAPAPAVPPTMATPSIPPMPTVSPTPAPAPKKASLIMGDGTRIALQPGVVSVGRSAESTVPLNDTNVSRKHAELRSRGEGTSISWFLVDLGSTNGTMLNGVKMSGEQKLKNGDALMFGNTSARFELA